MLEIPAIYPQLVEIRKKTDIALAPSPNLRTSTINEQDEPMPVRLRHYQSIGVYHLLVMKRFLLGDDTGLGKTIETLATLAYLHDKEPGFKVIIVAPKSALGQWQKEMIRFLTVLRGTVVKGAGAARAAAYEQFFGGDTHFALILNYHILARDWNLIFQQIQKTKPRITTIFDEATAFKSPRTKTHEICKELSFVSDRVYGLTATMLKNNLIEGYGILNVILPGLWKNKTQFMNEYCVTTMQRISGGRKIPVIVGYRNLTRFREVIDPYFLGRPKSIVSEELPDVITKKIYLDLTTAQQEKYDEALSGLLTLGSDEVKETTMLTQMIYCQQIVDSLALIGIDDASTKEEELFRVLDEELLGEKVVIYTNFRKMVDRLSTLFDAKKMKYTRITGAENKDSEREENRALFQKPGSGTDIMMITNAGSAAINLQSASAIIFFDSPWSYGDYKQLLGRIVRIGSRHESVLALHMVTEGTIDEHVLKTLKKKKALIDPILGGAEDVLKFDTGTDVVDIFEMLRNDARNR
jgi:SWI/SNF-related matrix-associated actin-dependent regulator 1 of chromatin subfamily A